MNLTISYRHLESTPSLNQKIEEKASHLNKYFDGQLNVDWVCAVEGQVQKSEVSVQSGHDHFHAAAEGQNLYKTLDQVLHKLESQIRKKNNKSKKKLHVSKINSLTNEEDNEQ
jgi:putative sigma-54 modulation protein